MSAESAPISALIDVIEAGRKFSGRIARNRFGAGIAFLADGVVSPYTAPAELAGITTCLKHMLGRLEWRPSIGILPSPFKRTLTVRWQGPHVELIAQSLVRTVQVYKSGLEDSASGLRSILLGDLTQGVEWACDAAERGIDLDSDPEVPRLPPEVNKE